MQARMNVVGRGWRASGAFAFGGGLVSYPAVFLQEFKAGTKVGHLTVGGAAYAVEELADGELLKGCHVTSARSVR